MDVRPVKNSDLNCFKNMSEEFRLFYEGEPKATRYTRLLVDPVSHLVSSAEVISVLTIDDFKPFKEQIFELHDYHSYTLVIVDDIGIPWFVKNYDWSAITLMINHLTGKIEIPLSRYFLLLYL